MTAARLISILEQLPAPTHILDVGSGDCLDADDVLALYPQARMLAVDISAQALRRAPVLPHLFRLQADVLSPPLQAGFYLVLLRHPDTALHAATWERLCAQLPALLIPRGHALITTYEADELDTLRRWLLWDRLCRIDIDPDALAPVNLHGRDRYVLVTRRQTTALSE